MKWECLSFLAQRCSIITAITLSVIASVCCVCLMPGTVLGTMKMSFHSVSGGKSPLHSRQVNGHPWAPSTGCPGLEIWFQTFVLAVPDEVKSLNLSEPERQTLIATATFIVTNIQQGNPHILKKHTEGSNDAHSSYIYQHHCLPFVFIFPVLCLTEDITICSVIQARACK